jgi:deferrochelatase/peroxidase EfeB
MHEEDAAQPDSSRQGSKKMQRELFVKGRSLGGCSDLTLLAPIKPGFVESLESVTYKTRIKRVLDALHGARTASHEQHTAGLLSDAVERVGAIHSVRVAVLEPEDKVLLAVTFDGSRDSYIRVLWDKVGTLLDLIFCGTVDYVTAFDHSFDEWCAWADRVQVETRFFYGPPEETARDALYYRRIERMEVRGAGGALCQMHAVLPSAEAAAMDILRPRTVPPPPDDPPIIRPANSVARTTEELVKLGLSGLAGLYRLADLHRPSTDDGEVLRRAAVDVLQEFVRLWQFGGVRDEIAEMKETRFARQLNWLFPDGKVTPNVRADRPDDPAAEPPAEEVLCDVQGGIVSAYEPVSHGVVLMLAFESRRAAAKFLGWIAEHVTNGASKANSTSERPYCNVAFAPAGLRALGMDEDTLALFPLDFRQGMASRAGLLGDVRNNHPRRWRLPRRAVGLVSAQSSDGTPSCQDDVALDTVHAVVQFRMHAPEVGADVGLDTDTHPLRAIVDKLCAENDGVTVLATQPLNRRLREGTTATVQEHFGYADGNGQPEIGPGGKGGDANRVHLGEIVLGHDNAADKAPDPLNPHLPSRVKALLPWTTNGSFLVVRKYRQFPSRLEAAVHRAAMKMVEVLGTGKTEDYAELVYAQLMGRWRGGESLMSDPPSTGVRGAIDPSGPSNDFDYKVDPTGARCPLHAHVRLANPRADKSSAARLPRLMRRSMSYGPRSGDDLKDERGIVFMAYSASLSEQYEVIQRWLTGGNSTGSSSGQTCPIVGVPENGFPRTFRFEHTHPTTKKPEVFTFELESGTPLYEEPAVLTRLEWGMYLFAPSLKALKLLANVAAGGSADGVKAVSPTSAPWQLTRGRELIGRLLQMQQNSDEAAARDAWKAVIEDPESIDRLDSASIWAALRKDYGGVLKTPYGVLVADRELLGQVLLDKNNRYSICGQFGRMSRSFGEIYLGMDRGARYDMESEPVNQAIRALAATTNTAHLAFDIAFNAATKKIDAIVDQAKQHATNVFDNRYEATFEVREVVDEVLADLCEAWFGIQEGGFFQRGSTDWAWKKSDKPLYPGHFTALSRYMFQPNPGPMVAELGVRYGQGLKRAMVAFVKAQKGSVPKSSDNGPPAPIAQAIFEHPQMGKDNDWVARTMVGVVMGFVAPIIGSVVNIVREWQSEGRFAELRATLGGDTSREAAHKVLFEPMKSAARMRPMPQIVWRTALTAHTLGGGGKQAVTVAAGDKVVLALVSGTQQSLLDDQSGDEHLMFGGDRKQTPHPTHACPGYDTAIDALLGTLCALLTREERLRNGSALLTFTVEGPNDRLEKLLKEVAESQGVVARGAGPTASGSPKTAPEPNTPLPPKPPARSGLILAVGDSWLDTPYRTIGGSDLRTELQRFGWAIPNDPPDDLCNYVTWGLAQTLEDRGGELRDALQRKIAAAARSGYKLAAVLVSAGGNDSKGRTFNTMLIKNDVAPKSAPLDADLLKAHLEKLEGHYKTVLGIIVQQLKASGFPDAPIIVHGYDFPQLPPFEPIPIQVGTMSWFRNPFKEKKYDLVRDRSKALEALKQLITGFNNKLDEIADSRAFGDVRYVNLTGIIERHWEQPETMWIDDLHPYQKAFEAYAIQIDQKLVPPVPPTPSDPLQQVLPVPLRPSDPLQQVNEPAPSELTSS